MAGYDEPTVDRPQESRWRKYLALILLFTHIGISAELLLLEHFESATQLIPLVLLGVGTGLLAATVIRPARPLLQALRLVMLLYVASGVVGIWLHYDANVQLEKELKPALTGMQLFTKALGGGVPTLSPGTMAQIGLLGLLYTFAHPLLRRPGSSAR